MTNLWEGITMKISTLLATTSLAVLGLTTTATAHDDEGWYLRGNLGYGIRRLARLRIPALNCVRRLQC